MKIAIEFISNPIWKIARERSGKFNSAWLAGLVATLAGTLPTANLMAAAAIVTDGTTGARVELSGSNVAIEESLGRRQGGNLFHGFERFNIINGGRAEFRGSDDVRRVIARVSGGEASSIDGALAVAIPSADLWFFNPAGIGFGPGGTVDIGGNLFLSTGNELTFDDGTRWSTEPSDSFQFTTAEPQAFGFLPDNKASLTLEGSQIGLADNRSALLSSRRVDFQSAQLQWRNSTLTIATGDEVGHGRVDIHGGTQLLGSGAGVKLSIVGGDLLVADGSQIIALNDDITPSIGGLDISAQDVVIESGSALLTESVNDGAAAPIEIKASALRLDDFGFISSNSRGRGSAGNVRLQADRLDIGGGSFVSSETFADGRAGDLLVQANALTLEGDATGAFTGITSQAAAGSTGNSGDVSIDAGEARLSFGVLVSSDTFAQGNAGEVRVDADKILIAGEGSPVFTAIASLAFPGALGSSGRVDVRSDEIEIRDGGLITAATFSEGAGGNVSVQTGSLLIDSTSSASLTGITSDTALGLANAGDIIVQADQLEVRGPGVISSTTFSGGDAGKVDVKADRALLDGAKIEGFSGITSQANAGSTGNAGEVRVVSQDLIVRNGSTINSSTFGAGDAGFVRVEADMLEVSATLDSASLGATGIFSDAQSGSSGNAGRVVVSADELTLGRGGQISSQTLATGDAGAIDVAAQELLISGGDIVSSTTDRGAAGSVMVSAENIEVRAGGSIGSRSQGRGTAGDIGVQAGVLSVVDSSIATSGRSSEGGRIAINAREKILIENSTITSTGIRPAAGASLINMQAPSIVLNRSRVESLFERNAQIGVAAVGNSGEANLLGEVTIISIDSVVAAGTSVDVTGLDSDIAGDLVGSKIAFVGRDEALSSPCAAAGRQQVSSFQARLSRLQRRPSPDAPLSGCQAR